MLYFDLLHFDTEYIDWLNMLDADAADCEPECDCPKCGRACSEADECEQCGNCWDCCTCDHDEPDDDEGECPYYDDDRRAGYWYAERAYQQRWEAYAD